MFVKLSFGLIISVFLLVTGGVFNAACTPFPKTQDGRWVQVLWPTEEGAYEVQRVRVESFHAPQRLQGDLARFVVEPSDGPNGLTGDPSVGRFVERKDGTLVPTDYVSHIASAIYAHMERLRQLDIETGVDDSAGFIWPITVGLKVNVMGGLQNNAVYDGALNALMIVPYTESDLPITFNAGVLAHEHFHAIFQSAVLNRIGTGWQDSSAHICGFGVTANALKVTKEVSPPETVEKLARDVSKGEYNRFVLRAMNEGLADFWGWLYSRDPQFVSRSLPSYTKWRDLSGTNVPLVSREVILGKLRQINAESGSQVKKMEKRLTFSYSLGTMYARFLYELTMRQAGEGGDVRVSQLDTAKALIRSMPQVADSFRKGFESEFIEPEILLKPLLQSLSQVKPKSCELYDSFTVPTSDASLRPTPCPAGGSK